MIHLVTYSDEKMTISRRICIESALRCGCTSFSEWDRDKIMDTDLYWANKDILSAERGSGFWLWKSFIIYKSLLSLPDNSLCIYSDAGVEFIQPVQYIIDKMDEDIFFFTNGFPHVEWCKGDVLGRILGWISIIEGVGTMDASFKQVQASVIFFRVNETTRNFVKEWLLYCQMPGFIDDSPSKLPNYPTFAEHRHDQAILTCLQIKYGYKLHFWPTNYSEHIRHTAQPEDNYPSMFNHHRKRNEEWKQ